MHRQRAPRRLWAWHLSALVYEWSYVQVAHQIDEDCLAFLGERLIGAVVADCGCGPGVVTEKLVRAGAALVVAHPERALWRYACAPPFGLTSYTPLHVVNRAVSRVLAWSGSEEYTLYTRAELLGLLQEAVPGAHVHRVRTQQRPYNLVALQVP